MPTSLSRLSHLENLRRHGVALAARAESAGLDAFVPSCPGWTVTDLVAHQAMVHRWARSKIQSDEDFRFRDADEIRQSEPDLLAYYVAGHSRLVAALEDADQGSGMPGFLLDAPAPREFWARRQAHETAIHAIDALAADLDRLPTADEVAVDTDFALDGIDELVRGFLPRNASALFQGETFVVGIRPTDAVRAWSIQVGPELDTDEGLPDSATATFVGTSAQLYLGLWNRGDEIGVEGDDSILARWREAERINWG